MTFRELAEQINQLPEELKDKTATVYSFEHNSNEHMIVYGMEIADPEDYQIEPGYPYLVTEKFYEGEEVK